MSLKKYPLLWLLSKESCSFISSNCRTETHIFKYPQQIQLR